MKATLITPRLVSANLEKRTETFSIHIEKVRKVNEDAILLEEVGVASKKKKLVFSLFSTGWNPENEEAIVAFFKEAISIGEASLTEICMSLAFLFRVKIYFVKESRKEYSLIFEAA